VTHPVNLEIIEAHLASVIHPTGVTLPAPLLVLPDDTPLYEEEAVLRELEDSQAEERVAKLDLEITDVDTFNSTLITVTFTGEHIKDVYRVNVPRQLVQVGRAFNSILKSPTLAILTPSEMEGYEAQNSVEKLAAFYSDDIVLRLFFPADISPEKNAHFNQVLNRTDADLFNPADSAQMMDVANKVHVTTTPDELSEIRADILDIIMSLIHGSEDALVSLYEYAENIDFAEKTIENEIPLEEEERIALIARECLNLAYIHTSPNALISQIMEDSEIDGVNDFQHLIAESGAELNDIFQNVLNSYYEEHPEALAITDESTLQEKVDYLTRKTNTIPMLGGLFALSDRINVDLLYSRDWNDPEFSEEENVTKGEYAIIIALIVAQRIQMFAKVLGDETPEEVNMTAMTLLVNAMSGEEEQDDFWVLSAGLKRLSETQPLIFTEYLHLSIEGEELEEKLYSPFGALMHRLGHLIVDEKWSRDSMMIAFEKQPLMQLFVANLFEEYKNISTAQSQGEDEESDHQCFSLNATVNMIENTEELSDIITQLAEALTILAGLNAMRMGEGIQKNSDEWRATVRSYLSDVANDIETD
jgi:hypothetical protein